MVVIVVGGILYLLVDVAMPIRARIWIGVFGTNNKSSFLEFEKVEFWSGRNQDQWRILNYGM